MSDNTNIQAPVSDAKVAIGNPSGSKDKATAITLKLNTNYTSMGPRSGRKLAKATITKAAAKTLNDANLKINAVPKDGETLKDPISHEPETVTILEEKDLSKETMASKTATLFMLAWDKMYKSAIGTDAYIKKYSAFLNARSEFYKEIGLPIPDPKKKAPLLSEDQKNLYRQRLTEFGFSYWETQISYKVPGQKAVRTLMYRTLKKPDLNKVKEDLVRHTEIISKDVKFSVKDAK
jgi:hypothetical protein